MLKTVATKSKEIQGDARKEISDLDHQMNSSAELRQMQRDIATKEKELDDLRHDAWRLARVLVDEKDEKDGEGENQS